MAPKSFKLQYETILLWSSSHIPTLQNYGAINSKSACRILNIDLFYLGTSICVIKCRQEW